MADTDAPTPTEILARMLPDIRRRLGWSQERLASEVSRLGVRMHPTTIVKIEREQRGVSLDEAIAIAAALDIALVNLVLPRGRDEPVRLTPQTVAAAAEARDWFAGARSLDGYDVPNRTYYTEQPEEHWRLHQNPAARALIRLDRMLARLILDEYDQKERPARIREARRVAQRTFDEITDYLDSEE